MGWHSLSWIDYSISGLILLSVAVSLLRGFVREALSLATWFFAFWLAIHFAQLLANTWLSNYIASRTLRLPIAFALLLLAALLLGAIVNFLCSRLITATGLDGTDKVLGVLFGAARGVLLVAVLLLAGQMMKFSQEDWWQQSRLIPQFQGLIAWLQAFVPEQLNPATENPTQLSDLRK